MRDEFEERERSVGDALPGVDEKPSESPNGHPRWDPAPRAGTVPADAYSSSSEPYISALPPAPVTEPPAIAEEPLATEPADAPESSVAPESPVAFESPAAP